MTSEKTRKRNSCICGIIGMLALILLDQWTKLLAVRHLTEASHPLIDGVFSLQYLENRGAAFGMMQGRQWLFAIMAVIIVAVFGYAYYRLPYERKFRILRIVLCFLLAGALGNLIDRLTRNFVVDFFYFELINFPIFNVADCYVTLSAVMLIILYLFYYKDGDFENLIPKKYRSQKESKTDNDQI